MASSVSDDSSFELYECQVCMTHMMERNPRMLACHHSFCQPCLAQLLRAGQISCPTCRKVTRPEGGQVANLPMNFYLLKMWERESKAFSDTPVCGLCKNQPANVKCKECMKLLCGQCKMRHDSIPGNKKHLTSDLCKYHGDSIEHVCIQCIEPVCITCIVQEHETHKDQLVELGQGVNAIKEKLATMVKGTELSTEKLMKTSEKVKSRINENDRNKQELESKRQYHLQELAKLDKMEEALNVNREQDQQILNTLADVMGTWRNYHSRLKTLEKHKDPDSLVKGFKSFQKAVEGTLEKTNHALALEGDQVIYPNIDLSPESNRGGSHVDFPWQPLCKFEKLTNILSIQGTSPTLQYPVDTAVMPSGNLCVADSNQKKVPQFDQTGKVVQSYQPVNTKGGVKGVSVYDNSLYILQRSTITKLAIGRQPKGNVQTFRPAINNMEKMLAVDTATIIISDYDAGKVYRYNPQTDTTSLLLQGLDRSSYISMATTEQGVRYAVTEEGKHRVNVYDAGWTLVTSVGGRGSSDEALSYPRSALITPAGDLLVADWDNHRISMFTCNGSFQKQLLTREEGIQYPVGLAYKHPHLWILESGPNDKAIKCYFIE